MPTSLRPGGRGWPQSNTWTLATRNRALEVVEGESVVELYLPRPDLLVGRVRGNLSKEMTRRWVETMDPHVKRGQTFETFLDWELMETYESEARRQLTSWVLGSYKSYTKVHFLVASKIVSMGVAAASLSLTLVGLKVIAHPSRAKFDEALARAL